VEGREQLVVRDKGVTLRVARDPDLGWRDAEVGHRLEEREPVGKVARLLRVAADDERSIDACVREWS
jgi:hypothetical protein